MTDNPSAFGAAEYDRKIRQTVPYYDAMYDETVGLVKTFFPSPAAWLDVGCGTGRMAGAVLGSLNVSRFVFCDISEEMLRIARQRFCFPGAEFVSCDVRDMPFENEFDVVTAVMVLHFLREEDRLSALRRCHAALKRGGLFVSFENFAPYTDEGKSALLEKWRRCQVAQGKTAEEALAHIGRFGKAYRPVTPSENLRLLRESGFRTAEILWLSNMQIGVWGVG